MRDRQSERQQEGERMEERGGERKIMNRGAEVKNCFQSPPRLRLERERGEKRRGEKKTHQSRTTDRR